MDRPGGVESPIVGCYLREDERMGATLDEAGELRLWDLRQGSESVRLLITHKWDFDESQIVSH